MRKTNISFIVLNINTLVEIMIAYSETKDWRKTFERCIPIRKVKVEDETGCGFDYRQVKSQKQMEEISEFRINRFEMKHTLHICCEKQKIPYEFKTRELTYDEYLEENKGRKHLETPGNTWKSGVVERM